MMVLVLGRAQPSLGTGMIKKPGCQGAIVNPSHSPQNPQEAFVNEGCGAWGGGISSWSILNGPDNNCYHSPWKVKQPCVEALGLFFVWCFLVFAFAFFFFLVICHWAKRV